MTEPTVTLEDVEYRIAGRGRVDEQDQHLCALVRAVADVVKAANVVKDAAERGLFAMSPPAETYFGEMCDALAAFGNISKGNDNG